MNESICDKYQCPKCVCFGTLLQFHICNPYSSKKCNIFIPKEEGEGLDTNQLVKLVKNKIIEVKKNES